ncbi:hypothetical protein NL676_003894 [Syzygium grande]|nr:hypothetical protein NL676_003894 [Syzygium grande]
MGRQMIKRRKQREVVVVPLRLPFSCFAFSLASLDFHQGHGKERTLEGWRPRNSPVTGKPGGAVLEPRERTPENGDLPGLIQGPPASTESPDEDPRMEEEGMLLPT